MPPSENGGPVDDQFTALPALPVRRPGSACHAVGCTAPPLVQWQRRLTDEELADEHANLQRRRDVAYLLRDTNLPDPVLPPLPGPQDFTRAVYACGDHAIDIEAAARIHQGHCAGPDSDELPGCNCEPEPLPEPEPVPEQRAPAHWAAAMAGGG